MAKKKKEKTIEEQFEKAAEEYNTDEINKLQDKVSRKTHGVGTDLKDVTDVEDDISLDALEDLGTVTFDTSNRDLMDIQGRDKKTNLSIEETISKTLDDLKDDITLNPTFQERIQLEQEYNYLCAQMPQLKFAIENKVDDCLSPDGPSKSFLRPEVVKGEETISNSDVKSIIDGEDLEEFVKETYNEAFVSGNRYVYTAPYKDIARRIMKRFVEKNNSTFKESPTSLDGSVSKAEKGKFRECIEEVVYESEMVKESKDELFSESVNFVDDTDDININLIDDSYMIDEAKDAIAHRIYQNSEELIKECYSNVQLDGDEILFSEGRKSFKNLSGCHIEVLENSRCIPIVINRELIGVYYLENGQQKYEGAARDASYHVSNMTGTANVNDTYDRQRHGVNNMKKNTVIKKVSEVIERNLNKRFIKKNRRVLDTIEHVMNEGNLYDDDVVIRFIPRKYLSPFMVNKDSKGLGRSQLHRARIMAHMWILLNYSNSLNKLFHEKDKILIESKTGVSTDISSVTKRALKAVMDIYPLPSQLMDINETHGRMADVGRVLVPVSKNGNKAFNIDRIEGQKQEQDYEYKKELEQIATTLVGTPYSLTDVDANADYATNLLSQDKREVSNTISFQISMEKQISEFITKVVKYEKCVENIEISVSLPLPKALKETLNNDVIDDIDRKIETAIRNTLGNNPDPEEEDWLKRKMFRKETGTRIDWDFIDKELDRFRAMKKGKEDEDEDSGGGGFGGF